MATCSELTALLAEARAAYHSLMTGGLPVKIVDQNGEQVEYSRPSAQRLVMYISELERAANDVCGMDAGTSSVGPMRFFF